MADCLGAKGKARGGPLGGGTGAEAHDKDAGVLQDVAAWLVVNSMCTEQARPGAPPAAQPPAVALCGGPAAGTDRAARR